MFSLILPVYNNKLADLKRTFSCLNNQDFKQFEVIVVDDGSDKECKKALDTLCAEREFSIQLFHRKHSGVSAARNFGIRQAKGKYIGFIDADDYIMPYMMSDAALSIKKRDYDIVYGLIKLENESCIEDLSTMEVVTRNSIRAEMLEFDKKQKLYSHMIDCQQKEFRFTNGYVGRGPIARFVKKNLCNRTLFNESLIFGEDEEWNLRLLQQNVTCCVIDSLWYLYLYHEDSSLHKFRPNFIQLHRERLNMLKNFVKDDESKAAYLYECLVVAKDIVNEFYLSNQYKGNFIIKFRNYINLLKSQPWDETLKFKNYLNNLSNMPLKALVVYCLIKTGLIFAYCGIKRIRE